mgnify:FL=1
MGTAAIGWRDLGTNRPLCRGNESSLGNETFHAAAKNLAQVCDLFANTVEKQVREARGGFQLKDDGASRDFVCAPTPTASAVNHLPQACQGAQTVAAHTRHKCPQSLTHYRRRNRQQMQRMADALRLQVPAHP